LGIRLTFVGPPGNHDLMAVKIRIGVLISGGGSNLQAILEACDAGQIDGDVVFVGSDNPQARGLARATQRNIPTFAVDYRALIRQVKMGGTEDSAPKDFDLESILTCQKLIPTVSDKDNLAGYFRTRAIAESQLLAEMARHPFDLLVLAGFMRVLTPYLIDRVNVDPSNPRIMNIHPALLPSFPGVDGYGDTFRYGCKVAGCTVHFVDYGEDTGPIIGQKAFPIEPQDTLDTVRSKGLALEWALYPECIQRFAQRRLRVTVRTYPQKNRAVIKRKIVEILP
jgi:phosphoribosylglycinamide formyltransferase 1